MNPSPAGHNGHSHSLAATTLAALGIVFGDIGTSPWYAFRECFSLESGHGAPINPQNLIGAASLIVWSLLVVVSAKYLFIILKLDSISAYLPDFRSTCGCVWHRHFTHHDDNIGIVLRRGENGVGMVEAEGGKPYGAIPCAGWRFPRGERTEDFSIGLAASASRGHGDVGDVDMDLGAENALCPHYPRCLAGGCVTRRHAQRENPAGGRHRHLHERQGAADTNRPAA